METGRLWATFRAWLAPCITSEKKSGNRVQEADRPHTGVPYSVCLRLIQYFHQHAAQGAATTSLAETV